MLPVRDQRPRAISLNHTTLPTQHRHHARAENDRTYMQRIPRYTGLVASKSESTVSRKREARRRDNPNTHSIWSQPVIHEHQHETEAKTQHSKHDAVTRKIREMFSDVLKDNLDSWEDMLFHLRTVIDHQALRIKSLEDTVVHGSNDKLDYKAELEAQKLAILDQQRQQFDALKHKYRIGLERIVDRWLSHEAEEQEKWMNTVKAQADERIARSEEQWKTRVAALEKKLAKYENPNA